MANENNEYREPGGSEIIADSDSKWQKPQADSSTAIEHKRARRPSAEVSIAGENEVKEKDPDSNIGEETGVGETKTLKDTIEGVEKRFENGRLISDKAKSEIAESGGKVSNVESELKTRKERDNIQSYNKDNDVGVDNSTKIASIGEEGMSTDVKVLSEEGQNKPEMIKVESKNGNGNQSLQSELSEEMVEKEKNSIKSENEVSSRENAQTEELTEKKTGELRENFEKESIEDEKTEISIDAKENTNKTVEAIVSNMSKDEENDDSLDVNQDETLEDAKLDDRTEAEGPDLRQAPEGETEDIAEDDSISDPNADEELEEISQESGNEKESVEPETNLSFDFGEFIRIRRSLKPIAHWVFSETGKNEMLKDTISGNNGSINHHPRDFSEEEKETEEGYLDDEYIEVQHAENLKPDSGTLSLWYSHDDISQPSALISCDSSDHSVNGGLNLRTHNGSITFGIEDGEDKVHRISGGSIGEQEWAQVSVSWGQYGMHLFINGQEVSSNRQFKRGLRKNHNHWVFGASRAGSTWLAGVENVIIDEAEFFRGSMDDIALYDKQLNHVEMNMLFEYGVEDYMNSEDVDIIEVPIQVELTLARPHSVGSASIFISGIPDTVELSAGRDDGDGNLLLYYDNLIGLKLWTAEQGLKFSLGVSVISKEEEVIKTSIDVDLSNLQEQKLD